MRNTLDISIQHLSLVLEKIQKQIVFQEQILQELDLDGVKIPEISLQVKEKIGLASVCES